MREEWALKNLYINPGTFVWISFSDHHFLENQTQTNKIVYFVTMNYTGPIQFVGPTADKVNHTLLLELGYQI